MSAKVFAATQSDSNFTFEQSSQQAREAMKRGNYAIAYCLWHPLAEQGNALAQYNIGWMYHNGYGLAIDDQMALQWWLSAASRANADAEYALGHLYATGNGVKKNHSISVGWYTSAALKQHEAAAETLLDLIAQEDPQALAIFKQLLALDVPPLAAAISVKAKKANVRQGPNTRFKVETVLSRGDLVIPVKNYDGWTFIGIPGKGKTAWIFSKLLHLEPTKP